MAQKRTVEIYAIFSDSTPGKVKGLFGISKMNITPSLEMEYKCKNDYKSKEGQYPEWNYQEQGKDWEKSIKQKHKEILEKSLKN